MNIQASEISKILKEQIKKFVENEVKPKATKWEVEGFIPREVFKKMGALGFLGITYPTEFGGSEMDVRGSVVFAEELGKSTFSGFAISSLVARSRIAVSIFSPALIILVIQFIEFYFLIF